MLSSTAFILYAVLPLLAWLSRKKLRTGKGRIIVLFILTVVTGSFLYIGGVWLGGWELERIWDPDGNGQLDDPTPEMTKAMDDSASDTGRSMVPLIVAPVTLVWVLINFAIFAFIGDVKKTFAERKN